MILVDTLSKEQQAVRWRMSLKARPAASEREAMATFKRARKIRKAA
jgi:hypothetical protein